MMRRITDWLRGRRCIGYAVRYVEPDGTVEEDLRTCRVLAEQWADWCRRDGCTDVTIDPVYDGQAQKT